MIEVRVERGAELSGHLRGVRVHHLVVGVAQTSGMAERVQVRELSTDECAKLLSI